MTIKWPQFELGTLAEFRNGLNYTQAARAHGGLPIVGVKDFQSRSVVEFNGLEELDPSAVDCGDITLRQGDILFVRSNGNRDLIGRSLLVTRPPLRTTTFSGFTIRLRFKDDRCDPRFFAYVLRGPLIRSLLSSQGGGTNINNLNQGILSRLRVPLPPLQTQLRVASILGAYDDLIGINQRRIKLLEETADRLYEEWFVRFRFPGHERHKIIEYTNGRCPQGWQFRRIGELTSFLSRGIPPKYDEAASTLVISQKCIRDRRLSLALARKQSRAVPSEKLIRPGDVLINSTGVGTLGRVAQVEATAEGLTVDSHVTIARPRTDVDRDFFGISMLRLEPMFERLGAGATNQTELNRSRIAQLPLLEPPVELRSAFGRHARPIRALAFQLDKQNGTLAISRDLLLPRLISGLLTISPAERELESAA